MNCIYSVISLLPLLPFLLIYSSKLKILCFLFSTLLFWGVILNFLRFEKAAENMHILKSWRKKIEYFSYPNVAQALNGNANFYFKKITFIIHLIIKPKLAHGMIEKFIKRKIKMQIQSYQPRDNVLIYILLAFFYSICTLCFIK